MTLQGLRACLSFRYLRITYLEMLTMNSQEMVYIPTPLIFITSIGVGDRSTQTRRIVPTPIRTQKNKITNVASRHKPRLVSSYRPILRRNQRSWSRGLVISLPNITPFVSVADTPRNKHPTSPKMLIMWCASITMLSFPYEIHHNKSNMKYPRQKDKAKTCSSELGPPGCVNGQGPAMKPM